MASDPDCPSDFLGFREVRRRILQHRAELRLVVRLQIGVVRGDPALVDELHDRVVQKLHAVLFPRLDHRRDLEGLGLADEVADGPVRDKDFQRGAATLLVGAFEEHLGNDGAEAVGERRADLHLLAGGENLDDAVHRLGGACRVECSEDEMARRGRLDGKRNRFQIAQFADEDDVRIFTESPAQRRGETFGVESHFPVVHDAALALVDEFDGVLDGDDVVLARPVRLVDDRRKGRGLSAPGGTRDKDQASGKRGKLRDDLWQPQLLGREDLAGNFAEDGGAAVFLHEEIRPVAGEAWNLVSEVDVAALFEGLDLVFRCNLVQHRLEPVVGQRVVLDPLDLAADSEGRLLSGYEVQVRCALLVHQLEKCVDGCHAESSPVDVCLSGLKRCVPVLSVDRGFVFCLEIPPDQRFGV